MTKTSAPHLRRGAGAAAVAFGILASRIFGLIRQRVFLYYLGAGVEADAFTQAVRIPNLLQNLFGEGALSASFIPVYARLKGAGDDDGRRRVAGAVFGILTLGVALIAALGMLAAPFLVDVLAPGFEGAKRDLTVHLVRILFPGAALLVLSAWCLGVLNSHGKFFLSYASPVIWNVAMIAALVVAGPTHTLEGLVKVLAWGSVVGSALQIAVQWPAVRAVLGVWRISLGRGVDGVSTIWRTFGPAFVSRGVTQLSAFLDAWVASFLIDGSVTILANAQTLYLLPMSLFGQATAAAQLPEMSEVVARAEGSRERLAATLQSGSSRVLLFVVPSAIALIVIGDVVGALIFRGGRFVGDDIVWLWGTLAAMSLGLVAASLSRVYASALFALHDTKSPQRAAIVRMVVAGALALLGAFVLAPRLGLGERWRVAALALGSSVGAWVEFGMLRRVVAVQIGTIRHTEGWRVFAAALLAAVVAAGLSYRVGQHPGVGALVGLIGVYGAAYAALTVWLGVPEARRVWKGVVGQGRRK